MEISDTEARILKAAEHEFITKGFAGTRTTTIAQKAGVTHAMLHYYFRTKDNLFERFAQEKSALVKQMIMLPLDDLNTSLNDVIRYIINYHIDFLLTNPELPRFIVNELFGNPEKVQFMSENFSTVAGNIFSKLQSKIDLAAAAGECRKIDAKVLMLDIVSLNVFAFLASPLINVVIGLDKERFASFMEQRKEENYQTIISKLNPNVPI